MLDIAGIPPRICDSLTKVEAMYNQLEPLYQSALDTLLKKQQESETQCVSDLVCAVMRFCTYSHKNVVMAVEK